VRRPRDVDDGTTRRATLGLVGGLVATAVGLAPSAHRQAVLEGLDVEVLDYHFVEKDHEDNHGRIAAIDVELGNGTGEEIDPLISTWDQRRKTRHNWEIDEGPVPLPAGETAEYHVVAPAETARLHAGVPAQITVYRRGEERWESVHVETPAG
jgi:hypothetical protein